MIASFSLIFGALLVLPFVLKQVKFNAEAFILGCGAFIIVPIVQSPLQHLFLIARNIQNLLLIIAISLCIGFFTGLIQETIKFLITRKIKSPTAIWVGYGFGLTEALLIAITSFTVLAHVRDLSFPLISLYERFLATFFHTLTTGIYAYGIMKGIGLKVLILMIIIHAAMNFSATMINIRRMHHILTPMDLTIFYITLTLLTFILFPIYLKVRVKHG